MCHSTRSAIRTAALILAMLCNGADADVDAGIAAYKRRDFATAFAEFSVAAKRDDPLSLNVLGIMYAEGLSVERNDKLAMDWFLKAQTMGSHEAEANLGRMYADGRGVPKSNSEALKHYREAALGGYLPAMKRLADIYERGELGVTPSPALAIEWRARLQGTSTGLIHSSHTPAESATPPEKPRQSKGDSKALLPSAAPTASKQMKRDTAARTPDDKNEQFEKQVWEQLEKYRQREHKQQIASTDSAPALMPYLKDLRAKLKNKLVRALPASKPFTGMTVSLSILRDGTLRDIDLDHGSGDRELDRKVLSTLKQLDPLPPPPSATLEMADVLVVTVKLPIE